jgi:dolichol-phosphate mannosyltransferase
LAAPTNVCVVVPTYNERENVIPLIEAIERTKVPNITVLFVDDASPDGTADAVKGVSDARPWVKILVRRGERGFSAAYQEGFRMALSQLQASVLVSMDADLQHPTSTIPTLLDAVERGADVAVASRYMEGGKIVGWGFTRRLVSRGANAYARWMLELPVRDSTSGFRAYTAKAADEIARAKLHAKHFEFQIATLNLLKGHTRIVEIPYVFVARKAGESKFGIRDIPRFFLAVARMRLG